MTEISIERFGKLGPERPTWLEKFVAKLHLPYLVGALVLALFLGAPGFALFRYLDSRDLGSAFSLGVNQAFTPGVPNSILPFYITLFVRFVRSRVVGTRDFVSRIAPDGQEDFRTLFGGLSSTFPAILTSGIIFLAFVPSILVNLDQFQLGPAGFVYFLLAIALFYAMIGTGVWVFLSSLIGVYRLGRKHLRFLSFYEDRMLGVGRLGSLSLSLAVAYFAGVVLAYRQTLFIPVDSLLQLVILNASFAILGVVMFLVPLYGIHVKMRDAKHREQSVVRNHVLGFYRDLSATSTTTEFSIANVGKILALDMARKEIDSLPTWPLDPRVKGSFAAIILSVTSTIIARLIVSGLHI